MCQKKLFCMVAIVLFATLFIFQLFKRIFLVYHIFLAITSIHYDNPVLSEIWEHGNNSEVTFVMCELTSQNVN